MKHAFSLVELSIVLVILGLLTGGILTGQNLIRAAELRSITSDFNKYQTAVMTFRDKYFYLPGDMPNATDFWGAAATCPGDYTTPHADKETCNGTGDGFINGEFNTTSSYERYTVWQHLANAGLIEGNYTGVPSDSGGYGFSVGENVPTAKLSGIGWQALTRANQSSIYFVTSKINVLTITGYPMKADEVWGIDKKIDDGLPAHGKVWVVKNAAWGSINECSTTSSADTAQYDLTLPNKTCRPFFDL